MKAGLGVSSVMDSPGYNKCRGYDYRGKPGASWGWHRHKLQRVLASHRLLSLSVSCFVAARLVRYPFGARGSCKSSVKRCQRRTLAPC
jgi:hypothetical protein